jgi:hypothetical protein
MAAEPHIGAARDPAVATISILPGLTCRIAAW